MSNTASYDEITWAVLSISSESDKSRFRNIFNALTEYSILEPYQVNYIIKMIRDNENEDAS